jgi:hypothetical protein
MNFGKTYTSGGCRQTGGFTLVEILVASGLIGMMFAALLSGLTSSVANVQFGREQMRATQIMVEKLDTVRLYAWDELNTTFIPEKFTEVFYPATGNTNATGSGIVYSGQVTIEKAVLAETYAPELKQVTVSLEWESNHRKVRRQMTTFVAQYGLQNYIR